MAVITEGEAPATSSPRTLPEILSIDGETVIPAVKIIDGGVSEHGHRTRLFEPTANTNAGLPYRRLPNIEK